MNVVFHVNSIESFPSAQSNATNILKFDDVNEVIILINGPGIKQVLMPMTPVLGVRYELCQNSLNAHKIDSKDLDVIYHVVPSGVYRLAKLQQQSYAYIKP